MEILATDEALERIEGEQHLERFVLEAIECGLGTGERYYVTEVEDNSTDIMVTHEPVRPGVRAAVIELIDVAVH